MFGVASGGGGASAGLLSSSDPRVRRVPFMSQRPTLSELKRVSRLLAGVFEIPAEVIAEQQARHEAERQQLSGSFSEEELRVIIM